MARFRGVFGQGACWYQKAWPFRRISGNKQRLVAGSHERVMQIQHYEVLVCAITCWSHAPIVGGAVSRLPELGVAIRAHRDLYSRSQLDHAFLLVVEYVILLKAWIPWESCGKTASWWPLDCELRERTKLADVLHTAQAWLPEKEHILSVENVELYSSCQNAVCSYHTSTRICRPVLRTSRHAMHA